MDTRDSFQNLVNLVQQHAIEVAPVLLVLVLVVYFGRRKFRSMRHNYKTRRQLSKLGVNQLVNVQWPDGMGHYFTIDRLILGTDGIIVLRYLHYPGKIFCAEHIDDWTQMLGQKSYRFKNPFYDLDFQVKAVSAFIPDVAVNGFLFFHQSAEFPKGHPDRVIQYSNIPEKLAPGKRKQVQARVMAAWEKLKEKVNSHTGR